MLPAEALRELESIMSTVDYDAGSILFLEQEQLNRVFVVLSGDVRLSLQDIGGKNLRVCANIT
jgi:CRP-like cAMP-binding protein